MTNPGEIKTVGKKEKQDKKNGIALRKMEGIPENRL